jgi:hypothetical protein
MRIYTEEELNKQKNESLLAIQRETVSAVEKLNKEILEKIDELEQLEQQYKNCLTTINKRIS